MSKLLIIERTMIKWGTTSGFIIQWENKLTDEIVDELTGENMTIKEISDLIKEKELPMIEKGLQFEDLEDFDLRDGTAEAHIFQDAYNNKSIADFFLDEGITWRVAHPELSNLKLKYYELLEEHSELIEVVEHCGVDFDEILEALRGEQ
mgnify:CR=1 FL=1